jgi:hypothetical protein
VRTSFDRGSRKCAGGAFDHHRAFSWNNWFNVTSVATGGLSNCSGFSKFFTLNVKNISAVSQKVKIISTTNVEWYGSYPFVSLDTVNISHRSEIVATATTFPATKHTTRKIESAWITLAPSGSAGDSSEDVVHVYYFGPTGTSSGGNAKGSIGYTIRVEEDRGAVTANFQLAANTPGLPGCTVGAGVVNDSKIDAIMPTILSQLNGGRPF